MISRKKFYSFFRSIGFWMSFGRHTFILCGSLLNSPISELYSIIVETSVDFSIGFNASNVRFMRGCVCLISSKYFCQMSLRFNFILILWVFILFITMSISLCHTTFFYISDVSFSYSPSRLASWFLSQVHLFHMKEQLSYPTLPNHFNSFLLYLKNYHNFSSSNSCPLWCLDVMHEEKKILQSLHCSSHILCGCVPHFG